MLYVRVGRPQRLAFAAARQDQLKECGIEIEIVEGDLNTVLIPKVLDYPNNFDTYLGGWSTALDPDDYSIFHSSEIPTKENPSANNFPGWKNPEADKLLEDGRQSSTRPSARRSTSSSRTSSTMSSRTTSCGRTSRTRACQQAGDLAERAEST